MRLLLQGGLFVLLLSGCASLKQLVYVIDPYHAFEQKQYAVAADEFIQKYAAENDATEKLKIANYIAESFRRSNKTTAAEEWYKKAIDPKKPEILFKYGLMLKSNGKYDDAFTIFQQYAKEKPRKRAKAKRQMKSCEVAQDWMKLQSDFVLYPLNELNSTASEYAPILLADTLLVFTSDRKESVGEATYGWTGEKHSDLYSVTITGDRQFTMPISFGDTINTEYNEGAATFDVKNNTLYFTHCGSNFDGDDYCKIFYSQYNDGQWDYPEKIDLFENDSINVGQPFVTPDGKQLYFSSNADGGYGDKDIYYVKNVRGNWGYPINLGPEINTTGYDGFPFISHEGMLYFSSNGHLGMGGLDIFSAKKTGAKWKQVENLRYPINSPSDDFTIIFNPSIDPSKMDELLSSGYLSSSRKGGSGNDDLFAFERFVPKPIEEVVDTVEKQEPLYVLSGQVFGKTYEDNNNPNSKVLQNKPLGSSVVEILGLDIKSTYLERIVTDELGKFKIEVENNTEYKVTASQKDFFTASEVVLVRSTQDTAYYNVEVVLDRIFKQREIRLENIYYDLDSYDIRLDAQPTLNSLATLLFENPSIQIELASHTDSRGSDKYNLELSQNRAQSAVDYLISFGVNRERLFARGYGEQLLVNECEDGVSCSEEQHQENRRTTFKVISEQFKQE